MGKITNIIIHCSDSSFGDVNIIRKWHKERGWRDIGYHFVILNGHITKKFELVVLDGSIETGRFMDEDNYLEPSEIGAHALGYNQNSIGICLIGEDAFTIAQMNSLQNLVRELSKKYSISTNNVIGHYETMTAHGKTCPNFDMAKFRELF